jgi:hypothetical protein
LLILGIARFSMLAFERRSLRSKSSFDHKDVETQSLPKSEFIPKRKN